MFQISGDLVDYFGAPSKVLKLTPSSHKEDLKTTKVSIKQMEDGMEQFESSPVLRMRFPNDQRTSAVRRMLDSSKPVKIALKVG